MLERTSIRRYPQCCEPLRLDAHYPALTARVTLVLAGDRSDGPRYEHAWVCDNPRCDYRELIGDAG